MSLHTCEIIAVSTFYIFSQQFSFSDLLGSSDLIFQYGPGGGNFLPLVGKYVQRNDCDLYESLSVK